jgi:hypothetical protein
MIKDSKLNVVGSKDGVERAVVSGTGNTVDVGPIDAILDSISSILF